MRSFVRDLTAGFVVFLVALPLCLGIALASNAPLFAGLVAGIIGGVVVGLLSGSHTSVSGPAAGLTAVVTAQLAALGSFPALQLALVVAGILQLCLAFARAGSLATFFPSSVVKGLLAAIGVILILKQIPHLVGYDVDPLGNLAFQQTERRNTLSELLHVFGDLHGGAAVIGFLSVALLVGWDQSHWLKASNVPAPLLVVFLGIGVSQILGQFGPFWRLKGPHLVNVPVARDLHGFVEFFQLPDFSQWANPAVYIAAVTIAAVASLETLLNLEAVDRLDPRRRTSPPKQELVAQGIGNVVSGMVGGLPITSVVVRGAVNVNAGARTKFSAVGHGVLLLVSVAFFPRWLNAIPLSCLAAILLATGFKLISPALLRRTWDEGWPQFVPFSVTVVGIVFTDLLIGIGIGLAVAIGFVALSSIRRPLRSVVERHLGGKVLHVELADQVSFLNRGALIQILNSVPPGGDVLLDARRTDYIDPDLLALIRDFKDETAPARGIAVSLLGFHRVYRLSDQTSYVVHSTRELQAQLSPDQVLQILRDGHARFRSGQRLTRDLGRQRIDTSAGQHPLAVVLTCIDSRTPAELIFDLGVGDIFSVRIAGNVISRKVLGSIEYGCAVAGAKLILAMGHTRCGAVTAAVDLLASGQTTRATTGCQHLDAIVEDIQQSIRPDSAEAIRSMGPEERTAFIDLVARRHAVRSVQIMIEQSDTLAELLRAGQVALVPAIYDITSGEMEFLIEDAGVCGTRTDG